jgi:hypothetical protein
MRGYDSRNNNPFWLSHPSMSSRYMLSIW